MHTCNICQVIFEDDDPLCKSRAFACDCRETVCVPCITMIILGNIRFIAKKNATEDDLVVMEKSIDNPVKCPYCRKEMRSCFVELFEQGYIYNMLLAIKFFKYLDKEDDVCEFRDKYIETLGLKCPI
jgi:hypothetical protein